MAQQKRRKFGWKLIQLFIVLLPLFWVLISGTYYLQSVWYGVQDFLPPAVSRYLSEQLKADVRIEQLNVGLSGLQATGVSLRHQGRLIASVPGLTLDYPLGGNPIRANVRQPELWISRDRQGRWNFEDLLPEPTEEEPVRVKLDLIVQNAKLNFEDAYPRNGRPIVRETIYPLYGHLRVRDDWMIASAQGDGSRTGTLLIHLVRDPRQTSLDGRTDRVQWSFLKHYFPDIPAEPLNASGSIRFHLLLPKDAPILYAGEGVMRADAVQLKKENKTLPWRDLRGEFTFSNESIKADLVAADSGTPAKVRVVLHPTEIDWAFQMRANLSGRDAALIWNSFNEGKSPVRGKFQVQAEGWGTFKEPNFTGQVQLAQAQAEEYTLNNVRTRFLLAQDILYLPDLRATYEDMSIEGRASIAIDKSPRFRLYARSRAMDIAKLPQMRGTNLTGKLWVHLVAQGTPERPTATINVSGEQVSYRKVKLGSVRARLEYRDEAWFVRMASISGQHGYMQVSGKYFNNQLDLNVTASEIDLNRLNAAGKRILNEPDVQDVQDLEIDGIAYLQGKVLGSIEMPHFEGQLKVFDGRVGRVGLEAALFKMEVNQERLNLEEIELHRRSAKTSGKGSIVFAEEGKSKLSPELNLQLTAQDISLKDMMAWLNAPFASQGLLQAEAVVRGTLNNPEITGEIRTEQALFDQVTIEKAQAFLSYRQQDGLTLEGATVHVAGGTVNLQGTLSPDQRLHFAVHGDSLSVRALAPYLPAEYAVDGSLQVSGEFDGMLTKLNGSATLQAVDLSLNRVELGQLRGLLKADQGVWAIEDGVWEGKEGTMTARQLSYDPEAGKLTGEGQIRNLSVQWVNEIARQNLTEIDPALRSRIDALDGRADLSWTIHGSARQPVVAIEGTLSELALREQPIGTIYVQGGYAEETLTLARFAWRFGEMHLIASGRIVPEGDIDLDAELSNFPIQWARLWDPSLPQVGGHLDLTLLASGKTESPDLRMSATITGLTYREDNPLKENEQRQALQKGEEAKASDETAASAPFIERILFSEIRVKEGSIETDDAQISHQGYIARLSGRLPFHWSPMSVPRDEPLNLNLSMREQSLDLLSMLAPVDIDRTEGTLDASLQITGTLDSLEPTGALQIKQGALAWQGLNTYLRDINLAFNFKEGVAVLEKAAFNSSEGGNFRIEAARVDLSNGLDGMMEAQMVVDGFRIEDNKPFDVDAPIKGDLYGSIRMHGPLKSMLVEGDLNVRNGTLRLPSEWESRSEDRKYAVNPHFNIEVIIEKGFDLSNASLQARMEGALSITGSLQQPVATGVFSIARGILSLPTARLRISPDSTILFSYPVENREGEITARLDLNLEATTHVLAIDFTGDPQRYLVELSIRGPLDDPENFRMTARSDPPGLSERRILTLLGRGSALEALAGGRSPSDVFREQLSDVVTGQLLPTLLDPLETGIATSFGLEQFVLDYNPVSPLSIYLVKNLINGVGVSYRRSFASAASQYEARLFYRLPFRDRLLQRLKVGWGFNDKQIHFIFIEGSILFR